MVETRQRLEWPGRTLKLFAAGWRRIISVIITLKPCGLKVFSLSGPRVKTSGAPFGKIPKSRRIRCTGKRVSGSQKKVPGSDGQTKTKKSGHRSRPRSGSRVSHSRKSGARRSNATRGLVAGDRMGGGTRRAIFIFVSNDSIIYVT